MMNCPTNKHSQSNKNNALESVSALAKPVMSWMLASGLLLLPLQAAYSQALDTSIPNAVQAQVSISRDVVATPSKEVVSLNLRNAELSDVLNILAEQGHFNVLIGESVKGKLTIDIKNVSINKALEYIFTVADLGYTRDGNTIIVASKTDAQSKYLNAKTLRAIPIHYKDASTIAKTLNDTIFKATRPDAGSTTLASYDAGSNSILVLGSETDFKLVNQALHELDRPRNRKVYNIRHSTPGYVATVLAANFFNPQSSGSGTTTAGGGAGAASGSPTAATGATGASAGASGGAAGAAAGGSTGGGAGATGGSAGGASGGAAGATGGAAGGASGGGGAAAAPTLSNFTVGGVTFIAEPISATLTVLATQEQMNLIDSIISHVDVKRPQAEIEVSLVEIQNSDLRSFRPIYGQMILGKETGLTLNQLDSTGNPTGTNLFTFNRNNISAFVPRNLNPLSTLNIRQSTQNTKGKILANPTIVALDGQSSTITITDQIPNISQTATTNGVSAPVLTTSITTQDAGITLTLTPTITNDGSIVLNLQPEVSQPSRIVSSGTVSTTLISKRTLSLNGVRVHDGQTLVIGGLLRETSQLDVNRVPGLDKLPIISAMFRAINSNNKDKTELVLMVTPHILNEDAVTYFDSGSGPSSTTPQGEPSVSNLNRTRGNIIPAALPSFTGVEALEHEEKIKKEKRFSAQSKFNRNSDDSEVMPLRSSSH
jgi:type II secretory pathway component GspD/PulD (secretin)